MKFDKNNKKNKNNKKKKTPSDRNISVPKSILMSIIENSAIMHTQ